MFVQTATIKGRGDFPLDMLRYDRCAPYCENDSSTIHNTIANGEGITPGPTTKIGA